MNCDDAPVAKSNANYGGFPHRGKAMFAAVGHHGRFRRAAGSVPEGQQESVDVAAVHALFSHF
jgi:hypothetical protein